MFKALLPRPPLSPVCAGVVRTLSKYYQAEDTDCFRVWLSADVDHFGSSVGDKGWGCGYRNFQMLLSALHRIETYASVLQGNCRHPLLSPVRSQATSPFSGGSDVPEYNHRNLLVHCNV